MSDLEPIITKVEDIGWDARLAKRTHGMKSSVIRELLKVTLQPDMISFAGGLPAPDLFPLREFEEACQYVLQHQGEVALQYGPTEGYSPLKEFLAEKMSKYGILVELENILITNGSQQGLDLIGKVFVDPEACVICSRPTYLGALQAWDAYEARYCTVPLDDEGMCIDELPAILDADHHHRFIYVLPNFHNPAGTTLPLERRKQLVEIARQHDLVIIEDDPYGELRYEGEDITPIFRLAPERTLYLSTFSKTLAPGIRLAWVVAPKPIIAKLVQAKQGADLHTGTFVQMVANDICQRGFLRQHVKRLCEIYHKRRDAMLDALAEHMPEEVSWTRPQGGLFLWARTCDRINTRDFLDKATAAKVAYVPGFAFYPGESGGFHSMRLNFSYCKEELINEGIYRLGIAMKEELA
ncbi:MAG TPA: PLP-dependent aminotransferase family protein [Anaerolineae bacterium]|nr:PLP-dependent aminotransferase family protein [Anaerolineae bacterium]